MQKSFKQNKLEIFRQKIEKSKSKNSYLRYSIELKLISDLINEIDKENELYFELSEQKQNITDILYNMGYKII